MAATIWSSPRNSAHACGSRRSSPICPWPTTLQFCRICDRCVKGCPPRAVPEGPPTAEPRNRSNLVGVRKWQVDAEKCFAYWTSLGCDCGICLRICPYNKDFSKWTMRLARRLAATRLRRLMLKLDIWLGYGKRRQPRDWWAQEEAD